jgi:hypothetical protein
MESIDPHKIFKGLMVCDAFTSPSIERNTCIAVNPPFGYIQASSNCKWATGKIQVAAWFLEQLLLRTETGQHVVAILPDVLRSGTRYEKRRHIISSLCSSIKIEVVGRFDDTTDVDVFIMHATKARHTATLSNWPPSCPQEKNANMLSQTTSMSTLGQLYHIVIL